MRAYLDDPEHHHRPLSDREEEVTKLVAESHTSEEIGRLLSISPRTVERHRENILAKLGMRDRLELTRWAIRHGLVEPSPGARRMRAPGRASGGRGRHFLHVPGHYLHGPAELLGGAELDHLGAGVEDRAVARADVVGVAAHEHLLGVTGSKRELSLDHVAHVLALALVVGEALEQGERSASWV